MEISGSKQGLLVMLQKRWPRIRKLMRASAISIPKWAKTEFGALDPSNLFVIGGDLNLWYEYSPFGPNNRNQAEYDICPHGDRRDMFFPYLYLTKNLFNQTFMP
jgi:hypothetical protein